MSRYPLIDMAGKKYGELTVKEFAGKFKGHKYWKCICSCGEQTVVEGGNLRNGNTRSCGHIHIETIKKTSRKHGDTVGRSPAPEYVTWISMKARCYNLKNKEYKNYGGRGIKICDRWLNGDGKKSGYECFLLDMGRRPEHHSIDRIDNNGDYEPANCQWASNVTQALNKRNNRYVEYGGIRVLLKSVCDDLGISYTAVLARMDKLGWSVEDAIEKPLRKLKRGAS